MANKYHYYLKISEYGELIDTLTGDFAGIECNKIPLIKKACWEKNFKLYRETYKILQKANDPEDFTYFPLYRSLGQEDSDFEFLTKEDALKEYENQINESVFDHLYDT